LKACGLFDLEPVAFEDTHIIPRDFFSTIVTPKLQPCEDDRDVCVMYNTIMGHRDGKSVRIDYYMWGEADPIGGITAMSRVTAFPAVAAALCLAKGEIEPRGIVAPEDAIYGKVYNELLKDLEERNILIKEIETVEG
jgi:lysine 6-dehydrogenase